MSDKQRVSFWVLVFWLSVIAPGQAGLASDFLSDPLRTVPSVIEKGATLPGDAVPVPCPAEKDFTVPLALGEAVDLALCNNPQIKAAWANIKIQAGVVGEARAAYLPTLSGTVSRIYDSTQTSGVNSSAVTSTTIYGTMTWRIFDFGGRGANRRAADNLLLAALASHNAAIQKTIAGVIQAYFDSLTAQTAWQAKEQSEKIALSTLQLAKRRETKGTVARSDTLQAATAYEKASLDKNRGLGDYCKAVSVLVYSMGVPTQNRVTLPADLDEHTGQEEKGLETWLDDAKRNHPAIASAQAQLQAARSNVTVARSNALPTLDFSANYFQNGRPEQSLPTASTQETTVGIALTIPIFDGFSTFYKIREAQAQVAQKEAVLQDTEQSILMDVVKAYADAVSSLRNIEASEALLEAAQEAMEVSERRYANGAADILEILNTQAALSNAKQERIRCLAEWRSARLRLLANAGLMGRSALSD
jgi:outer membrane protein